MSWHHCEPFPAMSRAPHQLALSNAPAGDVYAKPSSSSENNLSATLTLNTATPFSARSAWLHFPPLQILPHGHCRPSGPRAANSHSASVGRRNERLFLRESHLQ